jgi:hypothetical protein
MAASWASAVASKTIFKHPSYGIGVVVMISLAALMILLPLTAAGDPSEPAPPAAMM